MVMLWVVARRFSSDWPGVPVSSIQVRRREMAEEMYLVEGLLVWFLGEEMRLLVGGGEVRRGYCFSYWE